MDDWRWMKMDYNFTILNLLINRSFPRGLAISCPFGSRYTGLSLRVHDAEERKGLFCILGSRTGARPKGKCSTSPEADVPHPGAHSALPLSP